MERETWREPGGVKAGRRCRAASSLAHDQPRGVRGLARSGRRARAWAQAVAGRAGSLRWAEREAQVQFQRKNDFSFLFSNTQPHFSILSN
jgi:hypothetical protein